jgi:hypothetical protein
MNWICTLLDQYIYLDHRGIYVDLDVTKSFNATRPDTMRSLFKQFTTRHIQRCARYLQKLEELLEETRMFREVEKLESEF